MVTSLAIRTPGSSPGDEVIRTREPTGIVAGFLVLRSKTNKWNCPVPLRTVKVLRVDDATVPVSVASSWAVAGQLVIARVMSKVSPQIRAPLSGCCLRILFIERLQI